MVEPVKRERPLARFGRLSWRITISTRMPTPHSAAIHSISEAVDGPAAEERASANDGENSSPNASTSVNSSAPNATKTNQCAAPTTVHFSMRVWPSVSVSIVRVRASLFVGARRVGLAEPDDRDHAADRQRDQHDRPPP